MSEGWVDAEPYSLQALPTTTIRELAIRGAIETL